MLRHGKATGSSGRQASGSAGGPARRLSWPGVVISQAMCAFSLWADARWGFDFWWTTVMIASATGYAVAHLHPPYRRPLTRLLAIYLVWLAGGWTGRWVSGWLAQALR